MEELSLKDLGKSDLLLGLLATFCARSRWSRRLEQRAPASQSRRNLARTWKQRHSRSNRRNLAAARTRDCWDRPGRSPKCPDDVNESDQRWPRRWWTLALISALGRFRFLWFDRRCRRRNGEGTEEEDKLRRLLTATLLKEISLAGPRWKRGPLRHPDWKAILWGRPEAL